MTNLSTSTETDELDEDALTDLFDALAHPHRRAIVQALEDGSRKSFAELARVVSEANPSRSERDVQISLWHCHLPKLCQAGVLTHDAHEDVYGLASSEVRSLVA